jgi:hypothetical protein
MRKLIFLLCLTAGIGAGWFSARHDDIGLAIGVALVGAMFGAAIGGGLSQIGKKSEHSELGLRRLRTEEELEPIPGLGSSSRDMAANYWRDEFHPPFMKPPRAEYGVRMTDPEKNL